MMIMVNLLTFRFLVSALYLSATVMYILLLKSGKRRSPVSSVLLGIGLVMHLGEIIIRGAESGSAGGAPFASFSGFLSIFSCLLGLIYLFLEWYYKKYRIASLGAFYVPVLFVLHLWSAISKLPITEIPKLNRGFLFICHVVPTIGAYAAFTAAFVAGIAFLMLDRQLRNKKFNLFLRGLPNLDLVERVNASAVRIGLPLISIGTALGLVMGYSEWAWEFKWDFKVWITLGIILIYSAQLALRRLMGWTGRRAVIISIFGFILIAINGTLANYYFSQIHSFR
jgi:ABC-type transport system involved in cytochrome c biogenesis permease subunit